MTTASTTKRKRMIFYIPAEGYVHGKGWRVSVVTEGESGHCPTGNWPYNGAPGQTAPWFWGPTLEDARRLAHEENEKRFGISKEESLKILISSMFPPSEK